MKFDKYDDPGHGWVKVPRKLLNKLGIEDKITTCSRQRGDYAYLEEDCDLQTFWNAMVKQGNKPEFRHHSTDKASKIRGYASFHPKFGGSL